MPGSGVAYAWREAGEAVDQADCFIANEGQRAVESGQVFQFPNQIESGVFAESRSAAHRIANRLVHGGPTFPSDNGRHSITLRNGYWRPFNPACFGQAPAANPGGVWPNADSAFAAANMHEAVNRMKIGYHSAMPPTEHSLKYLKFLHLAHAMRQMPSLPALDNIEERLLNMLATAWYANQRIPVSEAARMVPDASERTVYRRLKTLETKGLIAFGADANDQRVRYVMPTTRTDHYFDRLGRCLERALGA